MGPVSRWAVNRPWQAIIAWAAILLILLGATALHAGKYNDSFSLPNTGSTQAENLLAEKFGSQTGNSTAQVLFSLGNETIASPTLQAKINELVTEIEAISSVKSVQSPYTATSPQEAVESGLVSPDGTVGKLNIEFDVPDADVPVADGKLILQDVETLNTESLEIGVTGPAIAAADTNAPDSEIVGIIAAIIIMLIMFGSVVAAGLPLLTALLGLTAGLSGLALLANTVSTASFAPTLAAMIGLGVGFDYSLFLLNRYRQAIRDGNEPKASALIAVGTAGRAIVFAAITVIIALSGLFVLGLSFLNGLAVGAGVTVVCVMITAVTLLPALISLLGERVFAWKMPWGRKPVDAVRGRRFAKYAEVLQARKWIFGGIALVAVAVMAIPALSMREGFTDASSNPPQNPQFIAYELTAQGFGVGANGPFIVVAELPDGDDSVPQAEALSKAIAATPGVAFASPVAVGSPAVAQDKSAAIITVIPTTSPQSEATSALLRTLRDDTIPKATANTGIVAYVGGATAVAEDFSQVLSEKLPAFLMIVVGLGFIVLMVLFRSLLIPLTAAITALMSFAAALGVSVFVFQWGNLNYVFDVYGAGPILPFLPVMLFAILFGLSMDYQVFLVSRMQEEFNEHGDNRRAVRVGLGGSGLVVVAAALIMFSVFMSFVFQSNSTIKLFGLSLAVAIAVDAFLIRLMFVPALMTALGKANWYLPKWLDKILPKVDVEGTKQVVAEPEKVASP
jgi:putative drug exporter of the RND superfamily